MARSPKRFTAWAIFAAVIPLPALAAEGPPGLESVIVSVDRGVAPAAVLDAVVGRFGGQRGFVYTHAVQGFSAQLPPAAINALRNNPSVLSVTPDRMVSVAQDAPTGYDRVESDLRAGGGASAAVDVDIAILDTGVASHPDLNVVARTDCSVVFFPGFGCYDGEGDDVHGHGTHVAGTAAAIDNDIGTIGIAPGARVNSVKVLMDDGTGFLSAIIAGIDWVTARAATIEVINMSLGWEGAPDPTMNAAIAGAVDAGVTMVVAAGNSNIDAAGFQPASHPDVIAVSAVADADGAAGGRSGFRCRLGELDDTLASFSNWGQVVDIAAPGVCITSTFPGGYAVASGTSMASPHVAGAAALYVALNGRDLDGSGTIGRGDVDQVKADLIAAGHAQGTTCGFTGDRDAYAEPLLFVNGAGFGGDGSCTVEPEDPTPPTAPGSLIAVADGYPVDLSWTAAEDPESGILEYRIHRNGELLTTVGHTATSYRDQATTSGTEYTYQLEAVNLQFGAASSELAAATASTDDPTDAGWWGFEEASGTTAVDSSAWRRPGSLVNGPGRVTGAVGGGIHLDGSDDRVDLDSAVLDGAGDVTFALWFRTLKTGMQTLVSGANPGNDNEVLLYLASPTELRYVVGYDTSAGVAWNFTDSLADGEWHHLAVIRNQALGQTWAYLDGSVVGGYGVQGFLQNLDVDFLTVGQDQDTVGGGFQSAEAFSGMLDEVRLYTRVLTSSEIAELAGADAQPPPAPTGLMATGEAGQVVVDWDDQADVTFRVERSTESGYVEVAGELGVSEYVDTVVEVGTTYSYLVTAVNEFGESEPAGPVSATPLEPSTDPIVVLASSQATSSGTVVSGGLGSLNASDDDVQVLSEAETKGRPDQRTSSLVHEWTFDLGTAVSTEIWVDASWDVAAADSFVFTYTSSGASGVLTVDNDGGAVATAVSGLSGIVTIRVEDTDRRPGERTLDSVAVDYLAVVATAGDPSNPGDADGLATGESAGFGTVLGGYETTWAPDDVVQTLSEELWAGGSRTRLEHTWTVTVPSEGAQLFGLVAETDGSESFVFECSVDGSSWSVVQAVGASVSGTVQFPCSTASGSVLIRLTDTDRAKGDSVLSSITIDWLYLTSS